MTTNQERELLFEGTYSAFRLKSAVAIQLYQHTKEQFGNNPDIIELDWPGDYHITTVYSKAKIENYSPCAQAKGDHTTIDPIGYEIFGGVGGRAKVLVLRVQHEILNREHERAIMLGGTTDFPDYKAHITLGKVTDDFVVPSSATLPSFPLILGAHYQESLREYVEESVKEP